jgi:cell division septal protein FtsQ
MLKVYLEERAGRIRGRRERRKMARVSRTRRQVLRYSFLFVLLFAGIAGFLKASWSVSDPDTDIIVSGNDVVSLKQIRKVLRPSLAKPVYSLNPKELEARVQSLPAVQHAFVRRYIFPRPHLDVQIMEEFPWACFAGGPAEPVSAVVSQTGRLVPLDQFPSVYQPSLKIYGTGRTQFNQTDVAAWSGWINFIAAQTQQPVDYVDLRKSSDIQVKVGDMLLKLGCADSMLSKRLSRLPSVLPVLATLKKENIEYVDLSLDSNVPLKISKLSKKEELIKGQDHTKNTPAAGASTVAQQLNSPAGSSEIAQGSNKPTM